MNKEEYKKVISMAVGNEIEAYDFYTAAGEKIENANLKSIFKDLAAEEKKHQDFLSRYQKGEAGPQALINSSIIDYKIAEHLEQPDVSGNIDSKDVYLVAAHRELNSFNFYKGLAEMHPQGDVREMFLKMANEEMKHKEKVEYLYSNTAFPQTSGG